MNLDIPHEERVTRIMFLQEFQRNLYKGRAKQGLNNRQVLQYDREIRQVRWALKKLDPDGIFEP
ncbi:MAG: hypothetical protein ACPHM0_04250 [Flavobacteriales bacterium]|jgi:hypothetical protein